MTHNIVLIGCGRLGCAMLKRWLEKIPLARFTILEPTPSLELLELIEPYHTRVVVNPTSAFSPDIAVLAVKPQMMSDALASLKNWLPSSCLIVSVAAGTRLSALQAGLAPEQPIVRAMPNVAALVGEAATVCVANKQTSNAQIEAAAMLMNAIGQVEWVLDETLLDAVTAVSGSGPGFAFLFVEELARAGMEAGLPEKLSLQLARQTLVGVGAMLKQSSQSAAYLRGTVTSPGGTTEAGLTMLMKDDALRALLQKTILAAATRAKELSN